MCLPLRTSGGDCGAWKVQDLLCAAHLPQLALIALSALRYSRRPALALAWRSYPRMRGRESADSPHYSVTLTLGKKARTLFRRYA